jgi:hypothetical protein
MWMRVKRLWPVLAVGVAIGGARAIATHQAGPWTMTLREIALIPSFAGWGGIYRLNRPQWSVVFELFGNASTLWCWSVWDGAPCWDWPGMWSDLRLGHRPLGQRRHGRYHHQLRGGFARVGFSYVLGVWLGRTKSLREWPVLPARWWWAAALPVPLMLIAMPWLPLPRALGDGLAIFVLIAPALWLAAHAALPAQVATACRWLGALSYPVYALHVPMLVAAKTVFPGMGIVGRLLAMACVILAGWMVHLAVNRATIHHRRR